MRISAPVLLALTLLPACPKPEADKADKKKEVDEKDEDKKDKKGKKGDKGKKDDDGDKAGDDQAKKPKKPEPPPPVCTVDAQKSWGKGINVLTGLTPVSFPDGTVAIGHAAGMTPRVLVLSAHGTGKLVGVSVAKTSAFAAEAPKPGKGTRLLWRVTPNHAPTTTATAFLDFEDTYEAPDDPKGPKWKRVVCGPADVVSQWVLDVGPAWFDDAKTKVDPIKAIEEKHPIAGYREVRECRTFFDAAKGHEWVVGSAIHIDKVGAKLEASSRLFVKDGPGATDVVVHRSGLKIEGGLKAIDYEVPVVHELSGGGALVAARYGGGQLIVQLLDASKKPKGGPKSYPGSFLMPDVADDGNDTVLVASMGIGKSNYALRALRATPALPATMSPVMTDDDDSVSESRAEFLRDGKGQRWLAYLEDAEKGKGRLEIIPVDEAFHAVGRPYQVTKDDEKASEARLVPLKDGGFLVAYVRDTGDGMGELVTEDLDCKVSK
ncbi:MAG: hypothetical protein JNL79_09280 [Myxococcales bacterium]|nr:hypothetical protein [Myxococcales bacterium]